MNNKRLFRWQSKRLGILMIAVLLLALADFQIQPALAGVVTPPRLHGRSIIERWRCVRGLPGDVILLDDTTRATSGVQNKCVILMGTALCSPIQNICLTDPIDSATPNEGSSQFPISSDTGSAEISPIDPDDTCRGRPPVTCHPLYYGSNDPEGWSAGEVPPLTGLDGVKIK